jgi:hypothetical protein
MGLLSFLRSQTYANFKALDPSVYVEKMARHGRQTDPAAASYRVWNTIVQTYSETLLTVPGDKLIALSGIAKGMMSILDDTYVAGM